jgi:hypothetical protein
MEREAKLLEIGRLRETADRLEAELARETEPGRWPPRRFYTTYHVLAGFVLGMFGAATSLLFNVSEPRCVGYKSPRQPGRG